MKAPTLRRRPPHGTSAGNGVGASAIGEADATATSQAAGTKTAAKAATKTATNNAARIVGTPARWIFEGRRLDMQGLADELGVSRVTLFRRVGSRE